MNAENSRTAILKPKTGIFSLEKKIVLGNIRRLIFAAWFG